MTILESTNLPARITENVVVGAWLDSSGEWQERSIALPTNLPRERRALMVRAAWWVDPTMLRWLLGLPVYDGGYVVLLTAANIIHRQGDGGTLHCGNVPDEAAKTQKLPLVEAVATIIGEDGKRYQPRPCGTCFATGVADDEGHRSAMMKLIDPDRYHLPDREPPPMDGCEESRSCLICPLEACRYDQGSGWDSNARRAATKRQRWAAIVAAVEDAGLTVAEAAEQAGASRRTATRAVAEARGLAPQQLTPQQLQRAQERERARERREEYLTEWARRQAEESKSE